DFLIIGFRKQFQFTWIVLFSSLAFFVTRHVAKHLPCPYFASIGTGKIQFLFTKPYPFSSGKYSRTFVETLIAEIIFRCLYIFYIDPCDCDRFIYWKGWSLVVFPVPGVPAFFCSNGHSLQLTSL